MVAEAPRQRADASLASSSSSSSKGGTTSAAALAEETAVAGAAANGDCRDGRRGNADGTSAHGPLPREELDAATTTAAGHQRQHDSDSCWYAVPAAWYRRVRAARQPQPEEDGREAALGEMPLAALLDASNPRMMRRGLTESVDFVLLAADEFRALHARFGADAEPVPLPVMENGQVEVRPLTLSVDGECVVASQAQDVREVLSPVPLFYTDTGEQVPRSGTVRAAMLTDGAVLTTRRPTPAASRPASDASSSPSSPPTVGPLGLVGLNNLGNTCFMNAALQCLSSTMPLTRYLLAASHVPDTNRVNPLGTGGVLVEEYAALIRALWSGDHSSVSPRRFKYQISRFAPQFMGYAQQDAQELITFLLDGLHEDLNRVRRKPYIAEPAEGEESAKLAWQHHKQRNDSVVVDLFHGQYKSTVHCPECNKMSVTYDPFMCLSLPLPNKKERMVSVTLVSLLDVADGVRPSKYGLRVPRRANVRVLKERLQQLTGIDANRLAIGDLGTCPLPPSKRLEALRDSEHLVAHEVEHASALAAAETGRPRVGLQTTLVDASSPRPPPSSSSAPAKAARLVEVVQAVGADADPNGVRVGVPLVFTVDGERASDDAVYAEALRRTRRYYSSGSPRPFALTCLAPHSAAATVTRYACRWTDETFSAEEASVYAVNAHASLHHSRHPLKSVDLHTCLQLWGETEVLDEDNAWYCSSCKRHQCASKALAIHALPRVLIVQLKRFQFTSWLRDKVDLSVDFPLRGLVMECGGVRHEYDLFAVTHHFGGLGGGHYTATCHRESEMRWYNFDDSVVSALPDGEREADEAAAAARIVSGSAYVLFYRLTSVDGERVRWDA